MDTLTLFDEGEAAVALPQYAVITRHEPQQIEAESMRIIAAELTARGIVVPLERQAVVYRAIHASADFDYAESLAFSDGAVSTALALLRSQQPIIVTDTKMAQSGISRAACEALGIAVHCFMADDDVACASKRSALTRAACSVDKAVRLFGAATARRPLIFAIGNAPTALVRIRQLYDAGLASPAFVVGVPVGFVNVVAAKELLLQSPIPHIVARGRKGGSTLSAAIVNALLYEARAR